MEVNSRRLILAHFWLAFAVFGVAIVLSAWQMFIRSPLLCLDQRSGDGYYRSLTAHGTIMRLCVPDAGGDGFRLCDQRDRLFSSRWSAGRGPGRASASFSSAP